MDGYEATHHIRNMDSEKRNVPIVALTANAMPEDREKCLVAGMNQFLTKPLHLDKLAPIVNQYCASAPPAEDTSRDSMLSESQVKTVLESSADVAVKAETQVDLKRLYTVVGNDMSFLNELVDAYVQTAQETFTDLKAALAREDKEGIARTAHKLKGASSNMCMFSVSDMSSMLERQATTLSSMDIRGMIASLEQGVQAAINELTTATHAKKPAA
jgi:CheY-like chemotaxis protein